MIYNSKQPLFGTSALQGFFGHYTRVQNNEVITINNPYSTIHYKLLE